MSKRVFYSGLDLGQQADNKVAAAEKQNQKEWDVLQSYGQVRECQRAEPPTSQVNGDAENRGGRNGRLGSCGLGFVR